MTLAVEGVAHLAVASVATMMIVGMTTVAVGIDTTGTETAMVTAMTDLKDETKDARTEVRL